MRIAFVDFSGWDYTPETPRQRPLGGSHSAMCYLAEELARQGHQVWILNGVAAPVVVRGVSVARIDAAGLAAVAAVDAVVVLNGCAFERAKALRQALGEHPLFIYWTQHADDQRASNNLADPAMRALWDGFVLISDWQARRYQEAFGLPADKIAVLRNAIGPVFRDLFPGRRPVYAERPWPPVLAYTSTPFRGLSVLLDAFPRIRAAIPGTRLQVFSSMAVYQISGESDPHADLYRRCRETEGVEYVGSLPQPELAQALSRVACLAYPNTFPETSCIAVMEALAAGCLVVTSALGALPETLDGCGFAMAPPGDPAAYADAFANLTIKVLGLVRDDPALAERYLNDQVEQFNATAIWPVRARQWSAWLTERWTMRRAAETGRNNGPALAQRLADRLPLGGGLTALRGRHGLYAVNDADDRARALQDRGEPGEPTIRLLTALLRPTDVAVEIGAGIGARTVALAGRVGAGGLVAAMPVRDEDCALLGATAVLNGLTQIRTGSAPVDNGGWARLADTLSSCRLVVIDADGEEAGQLQAAGPLFAKFRPLFYCRLRGRPAFDALTALAARLEYRLHWHGYADPATGATVVAVLGLPACSQLGTDALPVGDFAEAAQLFPGFAPED